MYYHYVQLKLFPNIHVKKEKATALNTQAAAMCQRKNKKQTPDSLEITYSSNVVASIINILALLSFALTFYSRNVHFQYRMI